MTEYNSLNVKLSNSQLDQLKSAIEDEVVLRLSSNMIGDFDDKINFQHELLLTNRKVANLREAFANKSSTDIKLSKTQISKMIQSGGFLGRLLGPLLKTGSPLTKNVMKLSGSGTTTLIIWNDEMKDIIRIVKSLEDSGLLLESVRS